MPPHSQPAFHPTILHYPPFKKHNHSSRGGVNVSNECELPLFNFTPICFVAAIDSGDKVQRCEHVANASLWISTHKDRVLSAESQVLYTLYLYELQRVPSSTMTRTFHWVASIVKAVSMLVSKDIREEDMIVLSVSFSRLFLTYND